MSPAVSPALPPALREALGRSTGPVRPLLPPAVRALAVLAIALAASAGLALFSGLRPDSSRLGNLLLLAPALVRIAVAVLLLGLAMREGVPGSGPAGAMRRVSLLAVPLVLVLLSAWMSAASPKAPPVGFRDWLHGALACYPTEILVAIPALGLAGWLLTRAYPLRPAFAAAAGASGAALIADAALHVTCPQTALSHTLGVHGAAVATIALAGAAVAGIRARRSV